MEDQVTQPIAITPVMTSTKIIPLIHEETLNEPTNTRATYSANNKELVYTCNITIPVELDLTDVSFLQYYEGGGSTILDFYFVYDFAGHVLSGQYDTYSLKITALKKNVDNTPIPLGTIQVVGSLIEDTDPKTSRRTVTTVRSITGEEDA